MLFKEATSRRIIELCDQFNYTTNGIAEKSCIPHKTLYDVVNCESKKHSTYLIFLLCKGLGIKMTEFYDSPLFDFDNIDENDLADD